MASPTQDEINTAVDTWFAASIAVDSISENTGAYNQIFDAIPALEAGIMKAVTDGATSSDDAAGSVVAIDDWRDTLRSVPLNVAADAEAQLDAAIPALKTAIAALFA